MTFEKCYVFLISKEDKVFTEARIFPRVIYRCTEFSINRGFSLFVRSNFRNLPNGSDKFKQILLIGAVGQSSIPSGFCFFFASTFDEINHRRANHDASDQKSTIAISEYLNILCRLKTFTSNANLISPAH